MEIVQDAFYIPEDIATGLATGLYRRIGGVVRYAQGEKKGQIVKHLQPFDLKAAEEAKGLGEKAFQAINENKKEVAIVAVVGAAVVTTGICIYSKLKNHENKVVTEFRESLRVYIEAVRQGNMDIDRISKLIDSISNLKEYKEYKKISIQLSAEEIDLLINRIYEYTVKLANDNGFDIKPYESEDNADSILNLQNYLMLQKKIFENAA